MFALRPAARSLHLRILTLMRSFRVRPAKPRAHACPLRAENGHCREGIALCRFVPKADTRTAANNFVIRSPRRHERLAPRSKQTWHHREAMSALPPKADNEQTYRHVCLVPIPP